MKLTELLTAPRAHQPRLFPDQPHDAALSRDILQSDGDGAACRAGQLLFNDDLDAAHELVQNLATPTGSLWHAVIHRRDRDFGNSKYWWHRTGAHPAFDAVYQAVTQVLESESEPAAVRFRDDLTMAGRWLPERFVDICAALQGEPAWALKVQEAEMTALLYWCAAQN